MVVDFTIIFGKKNSMSFLKTKVVAAVWYGHFWLSLDTYFLEEQEGFDRFDAPFTHNTLLLMENDYKHLPPLLWIMLFW